jgi:hypothetical protein
MGLAVVGLDHSPITGADGNIEYLIYGIKGGQSRDMDIDAVIETAWNELKK